MKIKLFGILLMFLCLNSYSQNISYFYKPAKQELETNINYGKEVKIGLIHNRYKSYFDNKKEYCTYIYTQIPISVLNIKFAVGKGTYLDVEMSIGYKRPKFEIDIGSSIKEPLIIEFKFNLF